VIEAVSAGDGSRAVSTAPSQAIDANTANPARRYNYWLGGKDNFAADRKSGDAIAAIFPSVRTAAVENRRFLQRAVTYLAAEQGVRQFLDIGTGLPADDNTHDVAQRVDPRARVVYVDSDPLVLAHARALLTGEPEGRTAYLEADLRQPEQIVACAEVASTLDLNRPVALLLVAVLHFVPDDGQAYTSVATLLDALAPGSYLVLSHATADLLSPAIAAQFAGNPAATQGDITARSRDQVTAFFDPLDLVEPGLTVVSQWRRGPDDNPPAPDSVSIWGGVAYKPARRGRR
jgi:hypothetical protein